MLFEWILTKRRFRRTVEQILSPVLSPLGFEYKRAPEYVLFRKPRMVLSIDYPDHRERRLICTLALLPPPGPTEHSPWGIKSGKGVCLEVVASISPDQPADLLYVGVAPGVKEIRQAMERAVSAMRQEPLASILAGDGSELRDWFASHDDISHFRDPYT